MAIFGPLPGTAKETRPIDGRPLFNDIFNPETYFPFGWRSASVNELLLTVRVSARDDILPAYALAIAYVCTPAGENRMSCDHIARMLRVPHAPGEEFSAALTLAAAVQQATSKRQRNAALEKAELEWVETSLWACEGAIKAFDRLATDADWQPNLHYSRLKLEHRDFILHPAVMWIKMQGEFRIASYEGWRNNAGASGGVNQLVATLDKCWQPAKAPPPWKI